MARLDALDRQLLTHADVGGPRKGKFVGIFYFQWEMNDDSGLHNITDIRAGKAPWGPVGSFHFWDQPYFGYYYRDDPWVIRKHAQLLGAAGQWRDVEPVYRDDLGDTLHRHYVGASDRTYADDSGRNDIIEARVSHTSQDVTFYVRTHADITAPAGSDWMLLYLDVDDNPTTGWLGFDVVVNRRPGQDTTSVERWTGDAWQRIGSADYRKAGNEMAIEVRRDLLGLAAGPVSLSFKWADNVGADADPMRFLDKGDTAPLGRFAYHYAGQ
ncbi:hypothetical protein SAMN05421678_13117 [Actinopolymorpha cephalotaxi]|uniref:Uncharacterized protein n=1 Tax=Actinopolymorpha cephalotaxi TaxID=504797 RepID=A0A1I3CB77_9ACTN|nr:hypothetical protein [Actinopolymorpha cephalotaxi]NYH86727.1 hypothetical protein [Actinopolymorpha cephalotaxi]SFH71727.1 hypothetical protein SAMN05421678_13117 [Actinopolymorpha cephalotaxi]